MTVTQRSRTCNAGPGRQSGRLVRENQHPAADNGALQGEHGNPRTGGLRAKVELRGEGAGTRYLCVPHTWQEREERREAFGRSQPSRAVGESQRGKHPDFVFVQEFKNKEPQPVRGKNNTAWKNARERAAEKWSEAYLEPAPEGFRRVRVHDLKHTFGG